MSWSYTFIWLFCHRYTTRFTIYQFYRTKYIKTYKFKELNQLEPPIKITIILDIIENKKEEQSSAGLEDQDKQGYKVRHKGLHTLRAGIMGIQHEKRKN